MARIVFIGLTITSSWGNGHATTYRALIKALSRRGHKITFLERDVPWYRDNRDLTRSSNCRILLYRSVRELEKFAPLVRDADAVIVGSYVPDGIAVGEWVLAKARGTRAFYDIDTPITLSALKQRKCEYLDSRLVRSYDVYFSFTGGPTLETLRALGSPRPAALYCCVDPDLHAPVAVPRKWRAGYLGTYAADRQPALEQLLFGAARATPDDAFAVAGPLYPRETAWPDNVEYIPHLPPEEHPAFYCAQDFALNLTRADMKDLGYSPSVRLFEAAACGVPIISDRWSGLDTIFAPGREILLADTKEEIVRHLRKTTARKKDEIAAAARRRVLQSHSANRRALELERVLHAASRQVPVTA
jgi:spore maturation protein CgeB